LHQQPTDIMSLCNRMLLPSVEPANQRLKAFRPKPKTSPATATKPTGTSSIHLQVQTHRHNIQPPGTTTGGNIHRCTVAIRFCCQTHSPACTQMIGAATRTQAVRGNYRHLAARTGAINVRKTLAGTQSWTPLRVSASRQQPSTTASSPHTC
jgi:hypothetical protein